MAVVVTKERKVNEAPIVADVNTLREYGHLLNKIVDGPPVVLTADLPPANPILDGLLVVEQGAGSTRNLVIYCSGLRVRFTGTNF